MKIEELTFDESETMNRFMPQAETVGVKYNYNIKNIKSEFEDLTMDEAKTTIIRNEI